MEIIHQVEKISLGIKTPTTEHSLIGCGVFPILSLYSWLSIFHNLVAKERNTEHAVETLRHRRVRSYERENTETSSLANPAPLL
jgi:hypothetical protein